METKDGSETGYLSSFHSGSPGLHIKSRLSFHGSVMLTRGLMAKWQNVESKKEPKFDFPFVKLKVQYVWLKPIDNLGFESPDTPDFDSPVRRKQDE